jgi:rod shape determining protein RodA
MQAVSRFRRADLGLLDKLRQLHWPLAALLVLLGLVGYALLYSAGGGSNEPWAWRHLVRLGMGLVLMILVALVDIRLVFRGAYAVYAAALALLVSVDVIGAMSKGAQRWIDLGPVQLQPSEIMKIALVLALARYFHRSYLDEVRRPLHVVPPALMILVPAALVLKQPDLGTAVILLAAGGAMLFVAGVRLWMFLLVGLCGGGAVPLIWSRLHDYQRQRILTFLDPEKDPLGTGYHIIQSKIALGSGGFWGKGYLHGTQAQLSFLPEKQTDFAFTMLGEELGFLGGAVVLGLYLAVLGVALAIAFRSTSQFGRLLAMGISCNLALYVVINVAMVTGMIPVVGVPLPMISYGGTAMLTMLIGCGLLLNVDVNREVTIPRFPSDL